MRALSCLVTWVAALGLAACSSSTSNAGGGASGGGGAGGAEACSIGSQQVVTWTLASPDVDPLPYADLTEHTGDAPVAIELDAAVLPSDPGTLSLDGCPPNADCLPRITTLTFSADGLASAPIPAGAFVHLSFWSAVGTNTHSSYYTSLHLRLDNLPSWGGAANPVAGSEHVWLAIHDHAVTGGPNRLTAETDPFRVDEAVACTDELSNLAYTMTFSWNGTSASTAPLRGGDEAALDVTEGGAAGRYTIHVLRAFDSIEPTAETAYWIAGAPPP